MRYPVPAYWRVHPLEGHDGDTVVVEVDKGGVNETREKWSVRLKDVWAPELDDPGGPETRQFVQDWLDSAGDGSYWPFQLETFRTPRSDKDAVTLGRYVGVLTGVAGQNLNVAVQQFVTSRGYGGGTREFDA